VKWLIAQGVQGDRGLLGTDTFGPDPGSDSHFRETALTLHQHRFTLENLTNLGALPATGSWIVWGGPRNENGSGAPSTVFGLVP
jgi:kynurenine formamidase